MTSASITRRSACLLFALTVLAACGQASGAKVDTGAGNASCVAPYLNDQPPNGSFRSPPLTVRPGDTVTVYGHWYTGTCNDTGTHERVTPLRPVRLTLSLPGGKTQRLGPFTPGGQDTGFVATMRIPAGTGTGTATIHDDRAPHPTSYTFAIDA